jgi:hypothetical protein
MSGYTKHAGGSVRCVVCEWEQNLRRRIDGRTSGAFDPLVFCEDYDTSRVDVEGTERRGGGQETGCIVVCCTLSELSLPP